MKKIAALYKLSDAGLSGYIYSQEGKKAFFVMGGAYITGLLDEDGAYYTKGIVEHALNGALNSEGWEASACDKDDFIQENMPWNKKISLIEFLEARDIIERQVGSEWVRYIVRYVNSDHMCICGLTNPFDVDLEPDNFNNIKVLLAHDGREIPEHLKG